MFARQLLCDPLGNMDYVSTEVMMVMGALYTPGTGKTIMGRCAQPIRGPSVRMTDTTKTEHVLDMGDHIFDEG